MSTTYTAPATGQDILDAMEEQFDTFHGVTFPGSHTVYTGYDFDGAQVLTIFAPGGKFVTACIEGKGYNEAQFRDILGI